MIYISRSLYCESVQRTELVYETSELESVGRPSNLQEEDNRYKELRFRTRPFETRPFSGLSRDKCLVHTNNHFIPLEVL